jgi:hypothetical protein
MAEASPTDSLTKSERLDGVTDQAIAACGGGMIRALILANEFLEFKLEARVSRGYTRGVRHAASIRIRVNKKSPARWPGLEHHRCDHSSAF